ELEQDSIGTTDNFFEFGGNSLVLTSIVNAIKQHHGVELSLSLLFNSPTIEAMALFIESAKAETLLVDVDDNMEDGGNVMEF
ncbi:MAG: acyl carrier protein, partial [Algicola sp.]|nr:acyl carrier protein [Algicola sp.]